MIIKNQLTMNRTITTILACICYFAAYAQSGRLFNTDHQLSSNLATQVFQDNNGFIWIATRNGLNVFDGYNFRSMRKGENDPRKPNTNCFNCITQDSHGCIVLGTNRGVLIHDDQYFTEVQLHNEQGKTFSAYIPHIKRLHNGNILIGTAGCGIYLMKKGTHTCIPFAPTLGKLKYIHHITEDRQGQLWLIADGNQLFLLNKKGQLIRHAFGTQDLNVRDIQQDSKGTIYLATESQGIYRLTPGSSVFTQITAIPNLPASTIFVNRNDRLFIGCNGEGITLYDPVTNMTYDNLFFSPQTNLSKSKVGSIIEDQQGNIWFSMLQKGVFMQPLSPNDFGYMGYRLGKFNLIGDNSVSSVMFDKDHLKPEEILEEKVEEGKNKEELNELGEMENEGENGKEGAEPEKQINTAKSTIAIVEDDEEILKYLEAQLSDNFTILTYPNGKVALPEIIRQVPDLVISDIMMPEMDGKTLCSKLKSNVNTNHIPVILLTAMSREEDQLEGLDMGADAYITKPFNMDILRRTILNLLSVRRMLHNKFTGQESQEDKVEAVSVKSPDDQLMERIMEVINENISDSDLSVDIIAQKVGISRVHLHRKMKELTNQTPHSFIRNIRLKQAARLLKDNKHNVTEVMYACGFSNAASFSTMFKNLYGCSPRDYMNQALEKKM